MTYSFFPHGIAIFVTVKKVKFSIPLFLGIFIILLQGFYIYVGVTTKDGRIYSAFLEQYANFPFWLSAFVAKCAAILLQVLGYTVHQTSIVNVTITGSRGVTIAWGCLGIGPLSLWVAFTTAHRCSFKYKLKWILAGVAIIFALNILRIAMIALSNHYNWVYVRHFNAHSSFNILTYVIILLLMVLFVKRYNRLTEHKTNPSL